MNINTCYKNEDLGWHAYKPFTCVQHFSSPSDCSHGWHLASWVQAIQKSCLARVLGKFMISSAAKYAYPYLLTTCNKWCNLISNITFFTSNCVRNPCISHKNGQPIILVFHECSQSKPQVLWQVFFHELGNGWRGEWYRPVITHIICILQLER